MPDNDLITAWLTKARHDLDTAKIVASKLPDYDDTIAFHCQQAIEKTLKAYLIHLDLEFKPVHDLGYLLNLIGTKDPEFEPDFEQVDRISRYAVQIRYPDSIIKLSKPQIHEAIELANRFYQLIINKIGSEKPYSFLKEA
ncbi:MAG: HEPN domain-containing protein [Bacteroidales bacterium]|nr:HEPN domain-containing protein [Bacteroidales bacterium]